MSRKTRLKYAINKVTRKKVYTTDKLGFADVGKTSSDLLSSRDLLISGSLSDSQKLKLYNHMHPTQ